MKFFTLSSTDFGTLEKQNHLACIWLGRQVDLVGSGPNCQYHYTYLLAMDSEPTEYRYDPSHQQIFGTESGWRPKLKEISADDARRFMAEKSTRPCYPDITDLPDHLRDWAANRKGSYRTYDGGRSMGRADIELVNALS